ncbi:MAG: site-specific DNA-methyltransferase [Deferribacterales bacterium]
MSKIDISFDAVIADQPYGATACKWDSIIPFVPMWENINRCAKVNAAIVLFGAEPFSSALRLSNLRNYKYDIIWDKIKGTGFLNARRQPMRNHELISIFYRKQCVYNPQKTTGHQLKTSRKKAFSQTDVYGFMKNDCEYKSAERYPRSIVEFSTDTQKSSLHPTQKPIALYEYLIKTYTNKGDIVLDFCAGSGTLAVAAEKCGRKWVCIEKEEKYCDIAIKRIQGVAIEEPADKPELTIEDFIEVQG